MTIRTDLAEALLEDSDEARATVDNLIGMIKAGVHLDATYYYDEEDAKEYGVEMVAYAQYGSRDWDLERNDGVWEITGSGFLLIQRPDGTATIE